LSLGLERFRRRVKIGDQRLIPDKNDDTEDNSEETLVIHGNFKCPQNKLGDEIDSARMPWVAFGETSNREHQPPEWAMLTYGVQSVLRATRIEATGRTDQWRDEEAIALESTHD